MGRCFNLCIVCLLLMLPFSWSGKTDEAGIGPVTASSLSNATDASNAPTKIATTTSHLLTTKKSAEEEEKASSMTIFFVLFVVALCILAINLLIKLKFSYLPESVAVVFLGAMIGGIIKLLREYNVANWKNEEMLNPTTFFLILLPPIIFESGYNLHKGNFFANLGSILVFAIFGTIISALVVGGGIYLLGLGGIAYKLDFQQSFAFGSLISSVDPVATLAIFHATEVDPLLSMLVFGESILNDAVAIVLTKAALTSSSFGDIFVAFVKIFFGSSVIGMLVAFISALLLKYVDLRQHPSLELGMMLIFSYSPYGLAEGLRLSGIMAILSCAIVMSHYTHFNLSPVTQVTVQHVFRTAAFVSETLVFAYLGMAIFGFEHRFEFSLITWSIVLILIGRAANVFPLSVLLNRFRETKIKQRNMFIMWFSGLRGAIAFALCLNLNFDHRTNKVLETTSLVIVLFTLLVFGGATLPLMKLLSVGEGEGKLTLSKTQAEGSAVDADQMTDKEYRLSRKLTLRGFTKLDARYLIPFFSRKVTPQELREAHHEMAKLTSQWYNEVQSDSHSSCENEDGDTIRLMSSST